MLESQKIKWSVNQPGIESLSRCRCLRQCSNYGGNGGFPPRAVVDPPVVAYTASKSRRFRRLGVVPQWRNFGLQSEGDQAKFLTWCTYKVGVRPHTPKKWGSGPPVLPKITPMVPHYVFLSSTTGRHFRTVGKSGLSRRQLRY